MNEKELAKLRENFPIVNKAIYMNHGAISPCPKYVRDAIHKHVENWTDMDPEFMAVVPVGHASKPSAGPQKQPFHMKVRYLD